MMAGSTLMAAHELAEAIAKSGLLPAEAVAKVREAATSQPDAKTLARDLVKTGTLTRWQAAQLLHGFSTLTVGKYRLLDQLASGETGRVYLAEHAHMNRRHAIKILSRRQTGRPDVLKRFLAEAQRASRLEHHNLCHVYDVDQDGEKYFLVMEYVEGSTVQKLVETSGPQPLAKAVAIALQAIDGLLHAHDKQVVHGDLKSANLIVDAAGTLKITDIGQARLSESASSNKAGSATGEETTEATALAAALFRAPELLDGKQAADPQCDVYSLGNVLCFLLSGKAAQDGDDASKVLSSVTGVPAALAALCAKMLAPDPALRPALDVVQGELSAAVRGALDSEKPVNERSAKPAAPATAKAKKSPVARAIEAASEVGADVAAADSEQDRASDNPLAGLAGLAINAPPRSRAGKPVAKSAPAKSPVKQTEPAAPAEGAEDSPIDAQPKKSLIPVIAVAAMGGGLLMLGAIALAVVVGLQWSKAKPVASVAAVVSEADKAKKKADEAAAMERDIAAAMAAIDETNPQPPAEANPDRAGAPATAAGATAAGATAAGSEPAPESAITPATPPSAADTAMPAEPPPSAPAQPAETATTAPQPEPAKTTEPAAKTEPSKEQPPKEEPAKEEPAKKEPAPLREPPKAEPAKPANAKLAAASKQAAFPGLPLATSLPKLEPAMTDPPPAALAPLVIGPCPPDATAQLKGGEHAMRGAKTKFLLTEGKDEQSLGKWDVVMTGAQAPFTIAQFSIQNEQLAFQWMPEGARHEYSPFLSNCKLVLSAGADQHELALREPLKGESLLVDLEKPGATVKWNLDFLPDPRKLVVEVARLGEAFPAHNFNPSQSMEDLPDETLVWMGADPENALLGIKFESSQTPKFVQVKGTGLLKQGGSAKPILSRTLQSIEKEIDQARFGLVTQEKVLTNQSGGTDDQKKLRKKALENVKAQQEELNARGEEFNKLQQLVEELKGKSEVHFRVYFLADDTQVDLVVTVENPPPVKKPEPKDDGKKKTDDGKKKTK